MKKNIVTRRTLPVLFPPNPKLMDVPDWFQFSGNADVSIIIPLYKSQSVLKKQIESWDLEDDGLRKEIIYIDDCCPEMTHRIIVSEWEKREVNHLGSIIVNKNNVGFGQTCNAAAAYAKGEFLIFLNADTQVTSNWVRPMVDRMRSDPKIGIVGNMHLKMIDGECVIDSAGSEWIQGDFMHIGRDVFQGERIFHPFKLKDAPSYILTPGEREMVTGACFMIRTNLFREVGGYNSNYRIGYWEDSELNMVVRQKNYKVYYEPASRIFHEGCHTKCNNHPFKESNRLYFFNHWVVNGRIKI